MGATVMPQCVHVVCRPEYPQGDNPELSRGLQPLAEQNLFRSVHWEFGQAEVDALFGGWVYLHRTIRELSDFGGRVVDIAPVPTLRTERRQFDLIIEAFP